MTALSAARVELYWLPLGAGDASGCVRWNGRIFEAVAARGQRRRPCDLYHSALRVRLGGARYAIEMAPAWGNKESGRGVVGEGPVGLPWLGRSRFFRYEIRRWRDGAIPDITGAVDSPRNLDTDAGRAGLLARSGHQAGTIAAPARGRAPGWSAGLTVAARGSPAPLSGHHGVFLDKEP